MFGVKKKKENKVQIPVSKDSTFNGYPDLKAVKPLNGYVFHSDYFDIDNQVGTILSVFHNGSAHDAFRPFWGVALIPSGLDDSISVSLFQQVRRMSDGWISSHQQMSEKISALNEQEAKTTRQTRSGDLERVRHSSDLDTIAVELANGAAYLRSSFRLLIKAPTLEMLDDAVDKIERQYMDAFATIKPAAYFGEQKKELEDIFAKLDKKRGKGFYFTSTEFAGAYNLVTHGIEDRNGEYVGEMTGDVNNSAVLFDIDGSYKKRVVVASENEAWVLNDKFDCKSSALWASKISQAAMLSGKRVVHLILDGTDLDNIGREFKKLTYKINMNSSDVNMFEVFGKKEEELALFSAQLEKLKLMVTLVAGLIEADRTIVLGKLADILTDFYIDKGMWFRSAAERKGRLRLVGIKDHTELPRLFEFSAWLNAKYDDIKSHNARDDEEVHAYSLLTTAIKEMLQANGDLFNCYTNDNIDGIKSCTRGIYDFSKLFIRGDGVAMAQFVNILSFAVGNLGEGDTLIVHGAEKIADAVKPYMERVLFKFFDTGGRVVYCYNDIDSCFANKEFNEFDKADYTIFGYMTASQAKRYVESCEQEIPSDLEKLICAKNDRNYYIHRGFDNVVFENNLYFGLSAWAKE